MKSALVLAVGSALALGAFGLVGCQTDDSVNYEADARTRPSVDSEMGGGMNRTGSGADDGSSASGMDRAGGGYSGEHGANSGAFGSARTAGDHINPDDQATIPGAAGPGGAPTPGR